MAARVPTESRRLAEATRVHLVGIGGSGMSSLATLLARQGKRVSGSDLSEDAPAQFRDVRISVAVGHRAEHIGGADLVITSAAVPVDNPELLEATRRGLPVLTHAQALGELMREYRGVAVAGTHGKSTTTAMLGYVLERAGLDPTVLVGAIAPNFDGGTRLGHGPHLVVEADEYDRRFLALNPWLAIITSIEPDHLDYFDGLEEIVGAFRSFVERVSPEGLLVTCADDARLASLRFAQRRVTYGFAADAAWRAERYEPRRGGGCTFDAVGLNARVSVHLRLSGKHNALNALGVLAAAEALGVNAEQAAASMAGFLGTERRFATAFNSDGIWVVDDYAHHPTAVRATLAAARDVHQGRLWAVFQPHTTNRVAELLPEFATCFAAADRLTLVPIYEPPGRDRAARSITSADLAAAIAAPPTSLAASLEDAETELVHGLRRGDLAVIMGAGDVNRLTARLARSLSASAQAR